MKRILTVIAGFVILCTLQYVSIMILKILNIAFPSSILGLIIFALLLKFKVIPEKLIKETCEIFITNLPLLFVPLIVGTTAYLGLLKQNFGAIIAAVVIATFITMILSALFVEYILKCTGKTNDN